MTLPPWPAAPRGWDNNPTSPTYETEEQFRARIEAYMADVIRIAEARGYRLNTETGLYEHPTIKAVK